MKELLRKNCPLKYRNITNYRKKDVEEITKNAIKEGIVVKNNNGFIAAAKRQSINFRVQGGAATMSKKAMINIANNEELNRLGFKMLLAVHDEIIGECPKENGEKAAELLCEVMKKSALPEVEVPFKCDPTIEPCWYYTDYVDLLKEDMEELLKKHNYEESINILHEKYCEHTKEQLEEMLKNS